MHLMFGTFAFLAAYCAAAPHLGVKQENVTTIPIIRSSSWSSVNIDGTVNFRVLNSHVLAVGAKIRNGLVNFQRNTGTPHPLAVKATGRGRGVGETLGVSDGHTWYGILSVGTPQWGFRVAFDTSSSDLFLPASTCDSGCGDLSLWDPTISSTANYTGLGFDIMFGASASESGMLYTDTVSVGESSATGQTIATVTSYNGFENPPQYPADGLMGMAFPSLSYFGVSPVFQTLISEGQVAPVFSFKLEPSSGQLYVGGANPVLYTGDFVYVPVTKQGFWEVTMDSIQSDGEVVVDSVDCIINTGAAFIIGPPAYIGSFYDAIGGSPMSWYGEGYYAFECDFFPSISLTFGGTSFEIPGSLLNLGPVQSGSPLCASGIIGQDTGMSAWTIGGIFLQSVYTSFDVGNARVGFAQLA